MRPADRLCKRLVALRRCYQVDMVRHEAVSVNDESEALGLLLQKGKIDVPVVVNEKNVLPVVATLGDVVGESWNNDSRYSRHENILQKTYDLSRK
jgi:hypothetical protein